MNINTYYIWIKWVVLSLGPGGYDHDDPPVLNGEGPCPYCHLSPCVRARPPSWLIGSAAPNLGNMVKRFKLYRKYWTLLGQLGVWNHPLYMAYKVTKTSAHDKRDVMPDCVLRVSYKWCPLYSASTINCYIPFPGGAWAISESRWSSIHSAAYLLCPMHMSTACMSGSITCRFTQMYSLDL